jgi:hypothetical protein
VSCEGGPCPGAGLSIAAAGARGCEVLLTESGGAAVEGVAFDRSLKGTFIREAPRVAVSFVSVGDQPIAAGAVRVTLGAGAFSGITVQSVSCVDDKANAIAVATATLNP